MNSVLHVEFISSGLQLASSGSDGLVKVWTIRTNECATTLDNHEDKIWALATKKDDSLIVSGSADARMTVWRDTTLEDQEIEHKEIQERLVKYVVDIFENLHLGNKTCHSF